MQLRPPSVFKLTYTECPLVFTATIKIWYMCIAVPEKAGLWWVGFRATGFGGNFHYSLVRTLWVWGRKWRDGSWEGNATSIQNEWASSSVCHSCPGDWKYPKKSHPGLSAQLGVLALLLSIWGIPWLPAASFPAGQQGEARMQRCGLIHASFHHVTEMGQANGCVTRLRNLKHSYVSQIRNDWGS